MVSTSTHQAGTQLCFTVDAVINTCIQTQGRALFTLREFNSQHHVLTSLLHTRSKYSSMVVAKYAEEMCGMDEVLVKPICYWLT